MSHWAPFLKTFISESAGFTYRLKYLMRDLLPEPRYVYSSDKQFTDAVKFVMQLPERRNGLLAGR
jgi:hypothetical protein